MPRVLGIDPGSLNTGYGIVEQNGGQARHVTHGVIRLGNTDLANRLKRIQETLMALIEEHRPEEASVERVFMSKNADSALKLGQARGSAIAACAMRNLQVFEYTPNQIKKAIVGRGHAGKQQVQHMVKALLGLDQAPPQDAADALAVSVCHVHLRESLLRMRSLGAEIRR